MDKTIEAESSEFSSSIEEFRRKESLEDIVQDDESLTALCAAKDGQDDATAHAVGPITEAERERKLSPRNEEEEEGEEVKEQDKGEGEIKDRKGKEKKRKIARAGGSKWIGNVENELLEKCNTLVGQSNSQFILNEHFYSNIYWISMKLLKERKFNKFSF